MDKMPTKGVMQAKLRHHYPTKWEAIKKLSPANLEALYFKTMDIKPIVKEVKPFMRKQRATTGLADQLGKYCDSRGVPTFTGKVITVNGRQIGIHTDSLKRVMDSPIASWLQDGTPVRKGIRERSSARWAK